MNRRTTAERTKLYAWCCVAVAAALAACGGGSGAAGSSGPNYCSTGTQLALYDPQPGSRVLASTKTIYVVSYYPALYQAGVSPVVEGMSFGSKDQVRKLQGPVGQPTPTPFPSTEPNVTPTPFPSPPFGANSVYYRATGFHLKPKTSYTLWVANQNGRCIAQAILGAFFATQRRF